ncbi:MAG: LysR family transcriptional regulator [Paracoccaceae bacterium]
MIDQLRMMAIFQAVAELGSFRAAAKRLNLSPSVISHHVSQLEGQLGLPLLYRSTRRMSLTDAGQDLLAASQRMTKAAQEGLASMNSRVEQPVGKLSITLNTASAHRPYADIYTRFSRAYPKVQLSLSFTDRAVQLEGSKFDVAIRGTAKGLDDSSYHARKLGRLNLCIFASRDYAYARPPVNGIDDLADWDRIEFLPIPWVHLATTTDGIAPTRAPRIAISCDSYAMARNYVDDGHGFMVETYPLVADDIRSGKLVELLPDIKLRPIEIFAVYPANAPKDSLARLFVDFLQEQHWLTELGFERT